MTRYEGRHRGRPARSGRAAAHRARPSAVARVVRAGLPAAAAVATVATLGGLGVAPGAPAPGQPALVPQASTERVGGLVGFAATPAVAQLDVTVPLGSAASRPPASVGAGIHPGLPTGALPGTAALPDVPAVPTRVLAAYVAAARREARLAPACHLTWDLLAGIGYVESGHARSGGSARPGWDGIASPPILGPVLDGTHGTAAVPDTDHGRLDGDSRWDRAVGPMQFIPSTWARYGVAVDHAGAPDPQRIDDSAAAAADYLCVASTGLDTPTGLVRAVYAYNHSFDYVRLVLSVAAHYRGVDPASLGVDGLPHDPATPAPAAPTPAATPSASPSPTTLPVPSRTYPLAPSAAPSAGARPGGTAATPSGSPTPAPSATAGSTAAPTHRPSPGSEPSTGPSGPSPSPASPAPTPTPGASATPSTATTSGASSVAAAKPSGTTPAG